VVRFGIVVAFAGSLLLSAVAAALGADLLPASAPAPLPPVIPAPLLWEGFYAGPSLGQAFTPRSGRGDFVGGAQFGYTWQFGVPVFGVEADVGALNGSAVDGLATVRARAGFALGRVMVYGTFGVAGVETRARTVLANTFAGPDLVTNRAQTRAGVAAGAGVEAFISESMSLKAEYLYAKVGDYDAFSALAGHFRLPLDAHIVRVALNYHFGKRPLDFALRELRPYVGLGGSWVHHTGRDAVHLGSVERYEPGGKAFAGAFLNDWIGLEVAYNYLGQARTTRVTPFGPVPTRETSSSIGASVMTFSDPLFPWFDVMQSGPVLRLFSRAGLAYKMTDEHGPGFSRGGDGVALDVGSGLQVDFDRVFLRLEYEYLSRVRTRNVIGIRHTPLSLSAGVKF
jgi:outer membrane immunogenic protein